MSESVADNALKALQKYCDDNGIPPLPPKPRDWCDWCDGKGCIACAKKRADWDAEYKRQFPNGPQPIFTARIDKPEEMEQLKAIFHADKIVETFSPGGGGIEEINRKCEESMAARKEL